MYCKSTTLYNFKIVQLYNFRKNNNTTSWQREYKIYFEQQLETDKSLRATHERCFHLMKENPLGFCIFIIGANNKLQLEQQISLKDAMEDQWLLNYKTKKRHF